MRTFQSFQDLASHYNATGAVSDITVFNSEEGFYRLLDKIKTFKRNERHGEGKQISSTLKNRIIDAVKEIAEVDDPSSREKMKDDLWVALAFYDTDEPASRDATRARAVGGDSERLPYTSISVDAMKRTKTPEGSYLLENQMYAAYREGIENCRRAGMTVNDLELAEEAAPAAQPVPPTAQPIPASTVTRDTPFIGIEEIGDPITIKAGGTTVTISEQPGIVENPITNDKGDTDLAEFAEHNNNYKKFLDELDVTFKDGETVTYEQYKKFGDDFAKKQNKS